MRTRKRFGQHFLEPVWADKVVDAIAPAADDVFLEIGPGPGILTLRLAPRVSRLVAIEIDRDLIAELDAETSLQRVRSCRAMCSRSTCDAALPRATHRFASPAICPTTSLRRSCFACSSSQSRRPVTDATLMLQREVADRIVAKPGTAEYGVLSVLVQWRADVTRLLAIPPGAFRPPPDVRSALIRLDLPAAPFRAAGSRSSSNGWCAACSRSGGRRWPTRWRRLPARSGSPPGGALAAAGIDPRRRPETLEIIEIARLADIFAAAKR